MNGKLTLQKTILAALIVALMAAALPLTGVSAAPQTTQPYVDGKGISNERLENIWKRMQNRYERVGKLFDNDAKLVDRAEEMISRLKDAGEPTAELEAALKAYQDALKQARPIYESCKGILNSHKGFDENGKVTDAGQAKETVKQFGEKLIGIRNAMDGTGKALVELMKSIRDQHKPAPTPTKAP